MSNPRIYRFHRLGDRRIVPIGAIVRALRIVKAQPLDTYYPQTLAGWGGTGREVLAQFSRYCTDEINRRGERVIPNMDTPARQARQFARLCARARPSECRWCGQTLARYVPQEWQRFCDPSCARSYRL